jgi:uncharacterized membrane protein
MKIPQRFKNYGLWISVASLVGLILTDAGVVVTPEKYELYVNLILTIGISAGIVNNPSKGVGFKDK